MARNATAFEIEPIAAGEKMAAGAYFFMYGYDSEKMEFTGERRGIQHGCPCGCGRRSVLFFEGSGAGDHQVWKIEQPFPQATLSPSIGMFSGQNPYHWHGFLRNGVFEEC